MDFGWLRCQYSHQIPEYWGQHWSEESNDRGGYATICRAEGIKKNPLTFIFKL